MTPAAQRLVDAINSIIVNGRQKKKGESFIDAGLLDRLKSMSAADMLALDPPSVDAGLWVSDNGFCRRLGAYIFGVSPETVDELTWQHLIYFQQIVTVNFIRCLEAAAP